MSQPVPQVTEADVERVVRRDFPAASVSGVLKLLAAYGGGEGHREVARVRLAVLKLADGNLSRLKQSLATAVQDYRDVLSYAEYPKYFVVISPSEKDEAKRQRAEAEDWRQYREWLEAKAPGQPAKPNSTSRDSRRSR